MCTVPGTWKDTEAEAAILQDMENENGEPWPYGDRRQELVFIGTKLKYDVIHCLLDDCLLTDGEMSKTPEQWKAEMGEDDQIRLGEDNDAEDTDVREEMPTRGKRKRHEA